MSDMKDSWKKTGNSVNNAFRDLDGPSIGHAFRDLGKSLIITTKTGVEKAVEWAERYEPEYVDTNAEPTQDTEDK